MRVWLTRTRPGADQTAARLKALRIDSLIDPVLEVRSLNVEIETRGFDALAFTSANGVAAYAERSAVRDLPAFAVGEATAQALRDIGFDRVDAAAGDLGALSRLLADRRPGRVLALGPAEPAGDMAAMTPEIPVTVLSLYRTVPRRPEGALAANDLSGVLVHSARGGCALAELANGRLDGLHVLALSEACAAPLRALSVKSITVAPFPDDASLATLTADVLSEAP